MARKRVLIATPRWGTTPPECEHFRTTMAFQLGLWQGQADCPYEFDFGMVPDMAVQFARERCAQAAIQGKFDYLAMIDDDMLGPYVGEGVDRGYDNVWLKLLKHDVDIVAPLAFMRGHPHPPVCFAIRGGWDEHAMVESFIVHPILTYPKNTLFECEAVGFGAVLIKTSVLSAMEQPWFMSTSRSGEDVQFCFAARKAGFRVFMDTGYILRHLAPREYIGEDTYEKENPENVRLRDQCGPWTADKAAENLPV